MAILTVSEIIAIAPAVQQSAVGQYAPFLDSILRRWHIVSLSSVGAFVANVAVESAHFKRTLEIASGAEYEGRKDLGNVIAGDGVKFKGRGLIQVTGRNAYKQCSRDLYGNDCLLTSPSILESPEAALNSAAWFWSRYKSINTFCEDTPETFIHPGVHQYTKFQWIVILVNGGLNDYDERAANYARARKVLNF